MPFNSSDLAKCHYAPSKEDDKPTCDRTPLEGTFYCIEHKCAMEGCHWRRASWDAALCWQHICVPRAFCKGHNCSSDPFCREMPIARSQTL